MEHDERLKKNLEKRRKANQKNIDLSYVIVGVIVLVLILFDYIILSGLDSFSWSEFVKNITGNLMGVLAAFLIFDIVHDKLAKDSYADEVSEQILQTLLEQQGIDALNEELKRKFITASLKSLDSDSEASAEITTALEEYLNKNAERTQFLEKLEYFSEEQKKKFVTSNVISIVDDTDVASMINNFMRNYLVKNNNCRIRNSFEYKFELRDTLPTAFSDLKHKDDYFFVEETLTYDIKYLTEEMNNVNTDRVSIGFAYDNKNLDKFLRDNQINQMGDVLSNCLFRESLDIEQEDMDYFSSLPAQELKDKFCQMFKPHLSIDGKAGELVDVSAYEYGIVAEFKVGHDVKAMAHTIDMVFDMPKKWGGILEVALVDPTRNPRIALSYSGDNMQVEMYSFLNKNDDTSYENTHIDDIGIYRIILNDTWVYPLSGIVFTIDKK